MQRTGPSVPSFGEELKRERLAREISLEEVSAATKISMRLLTALEASDLSRLPAPVFTRGFIRAYSLHVGLDPVEKINTYLAEVQPSADATSSASSIPSGRRVTRPTVDGGPLRRAGTRRTTAATRGARCPGSRSSWLGRRGS